MIWGSGQELHINLFFHPLVLYKISIDENSYSFNAIHVVDHFQLYLLKKCITCKLFSAWCCM